MKLFDVEIDDKLLERIKKENSFLQMSIGRNHVCVDFINKIIEAKEKGLKTITLRLKHGH